MKKNNLLMLSILVLSSALCCHFVNADQNLNKGESMQFNEPQKAMAFEKGKIYEAIIHTSRGKIICELYPDKAPLSVTNFIQLAKGGFYNELLFHRVVSNFVIQGGDPKGNGTGGPGYTIPAEIGLSHLKGALAWARLPDQVNPQKRSSGSQFYIALEKIPYLDGEYTVFGQTIEGMDTAEKIKQGDRIEKIEIVTKNLSQ
jgi:peptidyl-prolyl cis-trans isomerase B (cyclophilin B)